MEAMAKAPSVSAGSTRCSPVAAARGGKQVGLQREQQDEQDAEEERRRRLPDQGHAHRHVIERRVALHRGEEADRHRDERRRARRRSSAELEGGAADSPITTSQAGWRKWIERPKSPRRTLPRKTAYCTGSERSRPSSVRDAHDLAARARRAAAAAAPDRRDSRMTTKTTVETSQSATRARNSRGPRNATNAAHRGAPAGAPAAGPRPAAVAHARRNLKLKRRISNCWFGFGVNSTYFCSP